MFSTIEAGISFASVKRLAEHVLREEKATGIRSVTVILVNNTGIRELNARFLKKNRATDVMSFTLDVSDGLTGEVYVSVEMAKDQAARYKVPFVEELSRLVIHGVLHVLGYDDRNPSLRKRMKVREERCLKSGPMVRTNPKK